DIGAAPEQLVKRPPSGEVERVAAMEPEEPDAGRLELGDRRARGFRIDPVVWPAGDAEPAIEAVRVEPCDDLTGEPLGTAGHADPADERHHAELAVPAAAVLHGDGSMT